MDAHDVEERLEEIERVLVLIMLAQRTQILESEFLETKDKHILASFYDSKRWLL